jgi:hypothetical protein
MDKPQATVQAKQLSNCNDDSEIGNDHNIVSWKPGYASRFPIFGLGSLLGVIACAGASVGVLVGSNNVSSSQWTQSLAPNICLQTINAISNALLATAIMSGIAIAWWRKALHGATIGQLHKSWAFSMSTSTVALNLFRLDVIALAALAAKVAIVDSILFQRATSTYIAQDPPLNISTVGIAAMAFPMTAYVVGLPGYGGIAPGNAFMLGDAYSPIVNTWETSNGFFAGYNDWFRKTPQKQPACTGLCFAKVEALLSVKARDPQHCDGACYTNFEAIGFAIDCQQNVTHQNIAQAPIAAYNNAYGDNSASIINSTSDPAAWSNIPIFNSSFSLVYAPIANDTTVIDLALTYFQSNNPYTPSASDCAGSVVTATCRLSPAIISYPIQIVNYSDPLVTNGVRLSARPTSWITEEIAATPTYSQSLQQAEGFTVSRLLDVADQPVFGGKSALGGMANAMSQYLSSAATLTYEGQRENSSVWALNQQGILAQTMMFGPPNIGSCDCSFKSISLDYIIAKINELAFLTAVGMIDHDEFSQRAVQNGDEATVIGAGANTTASFHATMGTVQVAQVIHYRTNYHFMIAGIVSSLVCVMLVVPTFWRYGELGRSVTLGPIEVASAFSAPMLVQGHHSQQADVHGNIDEVLQEVGEKKVQYGFVEVPGFAGDRQSVRLAMAEPERVRPASKLWSPPMSPTSLTWVKSPKSPAFENGSIPSPDLIKKTEE